MSRMMTPAQRAARAGQPQAQQPARTITTIDSDAIRTTVDRLVDHLDRLGYNEPGREVRGRSPIAQALARLGDISDLKVLNMWLSELEGELVQELQVSRTDSAAKGLSVVKDAVLDIREAIR